MVVQKEGGFRELQNAMDLSNREKSFESSSTKLTAASASVQASAAEERDETVETLQSAFFKFKRNRQVGNRNTFYETKIINKYHGPII